MASLALRLFLIIVMACTFNVAPPVIGTGVIDVAEAQQRKRRGWNPLSPLMKLFGPPKVRRKRSLRRTYQRRYSRPAAPQIVRVRKNEDARRVLVVGDVYARGLAAQLDIAFAQSPDVRVLVSTQDKSGLITRDPIDWPLEIGAIVEEKRADVVVVMLGSNDYLGVPSETGTIQPENDAWPRAYGLRVQALLNKLAQRKTPVFWVGLAPMNDQSLSSHAARVSAIYNENATLAGGVYVNIWDSFADADGRYAISGPDVDGQQRQLRLKNGVGFTKAGYRKVAFFVERELRRRLSSGSALAAVQAITDEPEVVEIGTIIPLYDSRIGLKVDLAGLKPEPAEPPEDSLQYKLVVAGEALPREPGRIDDFRWDPSKAQ